MRIHSLPIALTFLASACKDDSSTAPVADVTSAPAAFVAPIQSITLSPASVTLRPDQLQQFIPYVLRSDGGVVSTPSLTWRVLAGTITSTGQYAAKTVTVSARASNGVTGEAKVVILADTATPPPPPPAPTLTAVNVTPTTVILDPGATSAFSVSGSFSDGTSAPIAVSWSATGGTITSGGVYTAGAVAGTNQVVARSASLADTSSATIRDTTTAPPPPLLGVYTTDFPLTENPLSEGAKWVHTDALLSVCKTVGGRAFGTQSGGDFDDSSAYLTGYGNNYEVEGTVWLNPALSGGGHREVEVLLRWTDDNAVRATPYGDTHARGYEINVAHDGSYMILGRFKGAQLGSTRTVPTPKSGDKFRARIEGQRIRVWWNDVLKIDYTDTDPSLQVTTGNPGIGFYVDGGALTTDFGVDAVTVTALP